MRTRLPTMTTEKRSRRGGTNRHEGNGSTPGVRVVTDEARAQARRGNVLAADIEAIYDQYRHRVYVWCLRIARNVEDAEDLTQDTFLLLCRKINTYRGESAFSTWLYRLATNIALMRLRRKTLPQAPLDEILETHEGAINPRQELRTLTGLWQLRWRAWIWNECSTKCPAATERLSSFTTARTTLIRRLPNLRAGR